MVLVALRFLTGLFRQGAPDYFCLPAPPRRSANGCRYGFCLSSTKISLIRAKVSLSQTKINLIREEVVLINSKVNLIKSSTFQVDAPEFGLKTPIFALFWGEGVFLRGNEQLAMVLFAIFSLLIVHCSLLP